MKQEKEHYAITRSGRKISDADTNMEVISNCDATFQILEDVLS